MRATADIVEFADDDMIFTNTYCEDVLRTFAEHPEADAIIFSVESLNPDRPLRKIKQFERISRWQALKYGCARLAIRREKLLYNSISFSLLFGGGARYGSGEDSLFLQECFKAGMKVYRSPIKVADVRQDTSSWFTGYNDKYYRDKGALFAALLPKVCRIYVIELVTDRFVVGGSLADNTTGRTEIWNTYIELFSNAGVPSQNGLVRNGYDPYPARTR